MDQSDALIKATYKTLCLHLAVLLYIYVFPCTDHAAAEEPGTAVRAAVHRSRLPGGHAGYRGPAGTAFHNCAQRL